jgi:arabinogalactan oligomer / maltooligosaccharide transport system permease protein
MTIVDAAAGWKADAANAGRAPGAGRAGRWLRQVGWRHLVALLAVVFSLFPIVFVISAAINPVGTLSSTDLVPTGAGLGNFHDLFAKTQFANWFANSLLIAGTSAFVGVFVSVCAAYAFSRMRFRGRRVGLIALLLIQMFPQFLAMVAIYGMFGSIGDFYPALGLNTQLGLLLLYLGPSLGVNTWLVKGFIDTVPRELDESAVVDGATQTQVYFRIILPLAAPILAVTALLGFIFTINEVLLASIFLTSPDTKTLAVGLYGLLQGQRNANFGMFAAGSLLTAIPTVALFQFLQRYITSGLTAGAVKG